MALESQLREVITQNMTKYHEVEVVRISDPDFPQTLYLTPQLADGTQVYDETGNLRSVDYVPMKVSQESTGEVLKNERTVSLQGINDLVAYYASLKKNRDRIVVDIMTHVSDLDGVLSKVARGPFRYFVSKVTYSQKDNTVAITISTNPNNKSETGRKFTKVLFPTLAGFE